MKFKALFLDRDGVINIDYGYVYKSDSLSFIDGIFELCLEAKKLGYKIFIVTNQSGIGRGYFSENQFQKLSKWIENYFQTKDIIIQETYFCPHHKDAKITKYKKECFFRKPNPGMILRAEKDHNIDLNKSILIGDKFSDIQAGKNAGISKNIFLNNELYKLPENQNCIIIDHLIEAINYL
tara:strand:+ start:1135 stop:1674 length:540 start_codon:yes stop_codon:yes gene_type:complete